MTSDSESGEVYITAFQGGTFQLTGKVKGGARSFTSNNNKVTYTLGYDDDDDDHFTSTIEWTEFDTSLPPVGEGTIYTPHLF